MKKYIQNFNSLKWGDKVSRKWKLRLIGRKANKKTIKKQNEEFIKNPFMMPDCHVCGCSDIASFFHHVEYPEVWHEYKCLRCKTLVAYEDNSPLRFVLLKETEESC